MNKISILNDDIKISYRTQKGEDPGVMFFNGFMSNKDNPRALFIENFCKKNNLSFTCFDYFGHGDSSGSPLDVTIGACKRSAIHMLDNVLQRKQILVGSSMGGWIINLVARERKKHVAGLIGYSNAPDFTKYLMWDSFSEDIKDTIRDKGVWHSPYYPITYNLIKEANQHLILGEKLDFNFPIILLHGLEDDRVPTEYSKRLRECYTNKKQVELKLIKGAPHAFNREQDLNQVIQSIKEVLETISA